MTSLPAQPILPQWPTRAIAILTTVDAGPDGGPHAIPVSSPVRVGEYTILVSLHRSRGSLVRLRARPQVALLVLAEGNIVFTARGTAQVMAEPMLGAPDYAAVEINVTDIDDHRQAAFTVDAKAERCWADEDEKRALGERIGTLQMLGSLRLQCWGSTYDSGEPPKR